MLKLPSFPLTCAPSSLRPVPTGLEHKAASLCLEGSSLSRQRSGFVGEGFEDLQQDDVAIFHAHLEPLLDPDR